jgi:hypothetical protein
MIPPVIATTRKPGQTRRQANYHFARPVAPEALAGLLARAAV